MFLTQSPACPLLYMAFSLVVSPTLNLMPPEQRSVSAPSNMLSIRNLVNMEAVSHPSDLLHSSAALAAFAQ